MNSLKVGVLFIVICASFTPLYAENKRNQIETVNQSNHNALNKISNHDELDDEESFLGTLQKRYRLHGKRSLLDADESETNQAEGVQDLVKRYRLHGKRGSTDLSNEASSEETSQKDSSHSLYEHDGDKHDANEDDSDESDEERDKRYRLMGKRYRLMGKRYRLMGKRYRLMGKRYRLMPKNGQNPSEPQVKRYRLMG